IASIKGESGHQEHQFMALDTSQTNQDIGEVYAMNFVYSGNFIAQVEKNQFDSVRMLMGIHPEGFTWKLEPGEVFTAPEVVMIYRSEEHTSELQSRFDLVCRLLLEKKKLIY